MTKNQWTQQADDYRRIESAIRFIEASFPERPSLDQVAGHIHLSRYHFQRLFKRWAGISPNQFLQFLTIEYAKVRLRESQSLLDVALGSGLSSPSRLHDLFVTFEAVTPGEYKRQGAGMQITYGFHDTTFGRCLLATTPRGICALHFLPEDGGSQALETLRSEWPRAKLRKDSSRTQPLVERIFAPTSEDSSRPFHLLLKGTNFQVNVWRALLTIPAGAMLSYQDVASAIGGPSSARAVAGALARNPVGYLIPCHSVITKVGEAHKYRWGAARKKAILGWEASWQHLREPHSIARSG
ncbi:bifunctional transcriptional activator/DNA repair enzyme AdaA [Chloroflexota bacterium]